MRRNWIRQPNQLARLRLQLFLGFILLAIATVFSVLIYRQAEVYHSTPLVGVVLDNLSLSESPALGSTNVLVFFQAEDCPNLTATIAQLNHWDGAVIGILLAGSPSPTRTRIIADYEIEFPVYTMSIRRASRLLLVLGATRTPVLVYFGEAFDIQRVASL